MYGAIRIVISNYWIIKNLYEYNFYICMHYSWSLMYDLQTKLFHESKVHVINCDIYEINFMWLKIIIFNIIQANFVFLQLSFWMRRNIVEIT